MPLGHIESFFLPKESSITTTFVYSYALFRILSYLSAIKSSIGKHGKTR